jgi:hypothetical protein
MFITVVRDWMDEDYTAGKMTVDGVFQCFTLEPADRKLEVHPEAKIQNKTAIPRGTYNIIMAFSPHFGRQMPHYENVPNFEYVMIHWGNYVRDTDGCTLVGRVRAPGAVLNSREAFNDLLPKITAALGAGEKVTVEVS